MSRSHMRLPTYPSTSVCLCSRTFQTHSRKTPINIISINTTEHTSNNQTKSNLLLYSWFPTKSTCFALHFAFSDIHAQTHQTRVLCFCSILTQTLPSAPHQPPFVLHSLMTPFPHQNQTRQIIFFFSYLKKHKQNLLF